MQIEPTPPHDPQCAARRAWASPHGLPSPIPPIRKNSPAAFNPLQTLQCDPAAPEAAPEADDDGYTLGGVPKKPRSGKERMED